MLSLAISPENGEIRIDEIPLTIRPGLEKSEVIKKLHHCYVDSVNDEKGGEWITYSGFNFSGKSLSIILRFDQESLEPWVGFNLTPPDQSIEDEWPSREDIVNEVLFIRKTLGEKLNRPFDSSIHEGVENFKWGKVWSRFDEKSFMADSGIIYGD